MSHISIKSAIGALGFIGVIAALCIALQGGVMQMQMRASAEEVFDTKDMVADILPPPMYLVELRLLLSQTAEGTINRRQARENFDRLKKSYEDRVAYWKSRTAGGLGEQLLGRQHETAERFMKQAREQLIDAPADAPLQLLAEQLHSLHPLYEAHRIAVDETVAAGNQVAKKAAEKFVQTQTLSRSLSVGILMLAFLGVAAGARWVNLQLQRPLKACADRARRIAQGDLSEERRNSRPRTDVIGELEFSMEDMRKQLADLVQAVRSNAEGVALSSNQIAMGNHDLAVRTEQQASALQETSSTMSSLSTAVHTSAGNARQANQVSAGACSVAERGGKVVGQVIEMIDGVADSSKRIADIIAVIDGIAFQTNILALNAAVEASRAGEQGRGFAVVAGEVRALAKRSSDAAHEIRKLIALSVEQVAQSTELVQSAGHTMQEIVNSSRQVSGLVSEISVATGEQSEAVAQVSRAAELMDQSTQQNAALVEECAAAAEGLKQQAQQLVEAVAIFKLASRTAAP